MWKATWTLITSRAVVVWVARQTARGSDDKRCFAPRLFLPIKEVVESRSLGDLPRCGVLWLRKCWPAAYAELDATYPVLRDWVLDELKL